MEMPLCFPEQDALKLGPHLPPCQTARATSGPQDGRPFVTLTFATSLDSALALAPGTRTALSGPQSKAMTHFLRTRHDAICVGVGTAIADDPGLNSRLESATIETQPRPIVIDPHGRWHLSESTRVLRLARDGKGLAPFIITVQQPPASLRELLEAHGGKYIVMSPTAHSDGDHFKPSPKRFLWKDVFGCVAAEGLRSIMIEGGGDIINSILEAPNYDLVDSVIVTIAPTWLGQGGVVVSPPRMVDGAGLPTPAVRLSNVSWHPLGEDVVLCGSLQR